MRPIETREKGLWKFFRWAAKKKNSLLSQVFFTANSLRKGQKSPFLYETQAGWILRRKKYDLIFSKLFNLCSSAVQIYAKRCFFAKKACGEDKIADGHLANEEWEPRKWPEREKKNCVNNSLHKKNFDPSKNIFAWKIHAFFLLLCLTKRGEKKARKSKVLLEVITGKHCQKYCHMRATVQCLKANNIYHFIVWIWNYYNGLWITLFS